MKKHNIVKIRTLAIVLMTLFLTIIIGCATGQVKQKNDISSGDTIVVGDYKLKVPDGYVGITSSEVPPMIKKMAKRTGEHISDGIYNKYVGTVILFGYLEKIDQDAEFKIIKDLAVVIDKGILQEELRKKAGKDFEHLTVESQAFSATDENLIFSATVSWAFFETSIQFVLKRNQQTPAKKGRIIAAALSRQTLTDASKLDVLDILNSAQDALLSKL